MSASASSATSRPKHRVQDIEQALRWAYQSELPKRREDHATAASEPASCHPMWRAGVFGGRIDCWNRDPGFPLAMGEPHPDALRIEAAVDELDEEALDITPYRIGEGLGEHVDLRHVTSITRRDVRSWIITYARNSKRPDLGGPPECEAVRSGNGKATVWRTVQVPCGTGSDGTPWFMTHDEVTVTKGDARDHGTFCKLHWVRSNEDVAEDRVRWALWHAGLLVLAEILAPVLQDVSVTAPNLPMQPWNEPLPDSPVVRPSILARRSLGDTRSHFVDRFDTGPRSPRQTQTLSDWLKQNRTA